jgi:hypothetical protein
MGTSSLIYVQIIAATSTNALLGSNPGGEYWYGYFEIFCSIWFAALLLVVFQIVFSIVERVAFSIFFIGKNKHNDI